MFSIISNYLEPFACLLYFVALIIHNRRSNLLLTYYIIGIILLSVAAIQVETKKTGNNIWIYDIVNLLTAICIGAYFFFLHQASLKKKIVLFVIGLYLTYVVIRNFTLGDIRLFDSIGYSIVSASVVIYVFMYFHQLLKNVTEASILKEFNFWLASGYLVYFAGSFIIFVSYYYLTTKILHSYTPEERQLLTALWGMHNVLLFISALSLLIGCLWINYRRKSV
ncbi:MAG: hypothetical protein ACXWWD_06960 [Chitinophagaceae bacterium]